jgi:four helix bundle protein
MNKNDLEERLIDFAVEIIKIAESMPEAKSSNHMAGQLLRSGTSPALNYGEAQSAESRKDFIHKIKIVLKELRESIICLKIIYRTKLFKEEEKVILAINESNELISIFVKSVETAQKNIQKQASNLRQKS